MQPHIYRVSFAQHARLKVHRQKSTKRKFTDDGESKAMRNALRERKGLLVENRDLT